MIDARKRMDDAAGKAAEAVKRMRRCRECPRSSMTAVM
jgi:hypothetical protein